MVTARTSYLVIILISSTILYHEKRSVLEEQQHNNVNLNKIAETVEQMDKMQRSLAIKSQELRRYRTGLNRRRSASQEMQAIIEKPRQEIPIKKKDSDRHRSSAGCQFHLKTARVRVPITQQSFSARLAGHGSHLFSFGENTPDWKATHSIIVRENFFSTIVNFCTEDISDSVCDLMLTC